MKTIYYVSRERDFAICQADVDATEARIARRRGQPDQALTGEEKDLLRAWQNRETMIPVVASSEVEALEIVAAEDAEFEAAEAAAETR